MSDKPIIQFELAQVIASLLISPPDNDSKILFIRTFYITISREWPGINYLRFVLTIIFLILIS